jgi:glucosylceramidase
MTDLDHFLFAAAIFFGTVATSTCSGSKGTQSQAFNPAGRTAQIVETTGDQSQLLNPQAPASFGSGGTENSSVITVDESTRFQTIDGFGASLTDSAAWVIANDLTASQQSSLMTQLFSPTQGIGLSFIRQPMGASDFAVQGNYSYDDAAPGQTDPQLTNFSIAHDTRYIIPLLRQALALNPGAKVMALPWSPPAWMKTTGTMNGGSMNATYFPSLAKYFVLFIEEYQNAGVPIYAVAVQNEPLNSNASYPTEYLAAKDESNFIAANLAPALSEAGLGSVNIIGYEHNWDNTSYPESVLASPAGLFAAGTSFHCYAGRVGAQSTAEAAYPGKGIWFTECSGTVGSTFSGDLVWNSRNLLIGATRNWARSVSLWNLALDQDSGPKNGGCQNCRGVVTVNTSTSPATITYNVEYYVLAHLSKYVTPGAQRINSNTFSSSGLEDVAFQNPDGKIILFVLNARSSPHPFSVSWKNTYFNYMLPAQSVATFTWK